MENKKQAGASSSSMTLDHLFGPKNPASSSSSGLFGSIFPPPSKVLGRDSSRNQAGGSSKYGTPDIITQSSNGESVGSKGSNFQNETVEPCYFSSSIYYGGQENYSPRPRSTESHHTFKDRRDGGDDDSNGNNPNSASRGNWWQGSLYY